MKVATFLILVCYLATTWTARILVLLPLGPRSHMHSIMPMIEALAERGHQLTLVTLHPPKTDSPNIHKIVMKELVPFVEIEWYDFKQHGLFVNTIFGFRYLRTTLLDAYDVFIQNEEIQKIKNSKNIYELAIVDGILNDFTLPLVNHLGIPFIIYDPGPGTAWNLAIKGVSLDYASIPPILGDHGNPMTFFQRMTNMMLNEALLVIRKYYLLSAYDTIISKEFPNARPISVIEKDAEVILANIHPVTSWLRSYPPSFIPIGAMHVRPPKELPKDLQQFADEAEYGLIIFTLGSNSQVSSMPDSTRQMFSRVFSRLKQRVIWKWEKESFPELPSNIMLVDWLPQQDLLGHKNVRLFITHGGLMGIQETVYHKVPILGLPLGRDQRVLLIKASEEGYGIKLEWEDLSEELLYESIQKILTDSSFKENVTRLSLLMHDELVPAREAAAYWVEHVLRHGGAKHLQGKALNTPFYQQYLLDVWLFLICGTSLIFYVSYKLVVFYFRPKVELKLKIQ